MTKESIIDWHHALFQRPLLLSAAIFTAALVPRLVAIGRYITPDELIWVYRAINFREALNAGQWAGTLQAGHPGVITMWLGTLATSIQLLVNPADEEVYRWITQLAWLTPDNMKAFQQLSIFLSSGRLIVAIVNSMGIVFVFWLSRRLLGNIFALLAAAFLVLDPFFAGLSGILHVDGLATTFATLSLLSLSISLVSENHEPELRSQLLIAFLSGSTAALAVLAKSPAVLLVPVAAIVLFCSLWTNRQNPLLSRLKRSILLGLVWVGSFLLILFMLFPALWTSPIDVWQMMSSNANRHVEEALRQTFFMGQVAFDHGNLFYPIALAWRMGPVVMVGLIILSFLLLRPQWRRQLPKLLLLVLTVWIVVFVVGITLAAKKFDRYALPVVPALSLLAAVGWTVWLRPADRAKRILLGSLVTVQLIYLVFVTPYPLAAYNLLLGGPYSAGYVLPIGWGEGISSAGSWLSRQSAADSKSAVSGIAPSLAPFFSGVTLLAEDDSYEAADYIIVTANSRQMNSQGVKESTRELELIEVVRYGGLDQAWVYQNPRPQRQEIDLVDLPQPLTFGTQMQLLSQELACNGNEVLFSARWDRGQGDERYLVKLRLQDGNGHEWSYLETALLNEIYFYPEHWQRGETPLITYALDLPPAIAPGDYQLELSVLDESSGAQLPVSAENEPFLGVSTIVGEVEVTQLEDMVAVQDLEMVRVDGIAWEKDALRLLGHGELPQRVVTGGELILDLYWQAEDILPKGVQAAWQLGDEEPVLLPLSRYDSELWQPGTIIHEKYWLQVPGDVGADQITLAVQPVSASGSPMNGSNYVLGNVEIQALDRLFSLPEKIEIPLYAEFEPGIRLRGVEPGTDEAAAGTVFKLDLIWQAENGTPEPITAFVHLIDDQGEIRAQVDRWPGGLPSNIWVEDQVIIDEYELLLPGDLDPGAYQIVVGLYSAENGMRLPAVDADGRRLKDDAFLLPVIVTVHP